jgi:hypothetical protein
LAAETRDNPGHCFAAAGTESSSSQIERLTGQTNLAGQRSFSGLAGAVEEITGVSRDVAISETG